MIILIILFGNYKNTQNVLNKQKEEFETEREMLQCEINDLHGKNGALQEENDELKATIEELREEILALAGKEQEIHSRV